MDVPISRSAEKLYHTLFRFLEAHVDRVAELEVLPSSYALPTPNDPILIDANCLGIRQKDLATAYMVAHRTFFQNYQSVVSYGLLVDTIILIFWAPEHLTAVNWRKRFIKSVFEISPDEAAQLLRRELCMLDTFCTSHLPKHTKSPTLWQHRYWLMSNYLLKIPAFSPTFYDELESVLKAAEKHFANYTAFDYARRLIFILPPEPTRSPSFVENSAVRVSDLAMVLDQIKGFCHAHPHDISGWTYYAFMLEERSHLKPEAVRDTQAFTHRGGRNTIAVKRFLEIINGTLTK